MTRAASTFALVLLVAACGGREVRPVPEAVLAALDARSGVLAPDASVPGWMATGLEPLKEGLRRIQEGDPEVRALSRTESLRRARDAQVVLVVDLHDLDPCRVAFARAVVELSEAEARRAGRVAIGLESVPLSLEDALRQARGAWPADGRDALLDALAAAWPWPVRETARLLRLPALLRCPLLGAGRATGGAGVSPRAGTPDGERQPGFDLQHVPSFEDWKYGTDFHRGNRNALARVGTWLREAPGRRVFVLYGAAHHLGEGNLRQGLRAEGFDVLVLAPFVPEWEAALRRRYGRAAEHTWYEVLPGVLRPSYVRDAEILALGEPRARTLELPR